MRLLKLEKKLAQDNDVFRCLECGYLFSPQAQTESNPAASRTAAVRSGYPAPIELNKELDIELGNART